MYSRTSIDIGTRNDWKTLAAFSDRSETTLYSTLPLLVRLTRLRARDAGKSKHDNVIKRRRNCSSYTQLPYRLIRVALRGKVAVIAPA